MTPTYKEPTIPFNRPFIVGKELFYIADAVVSGQISAGGKYTHLCENFLQENYRIPRCLLTSSCTAALELAALLCDLGPGDEVVLPSFTFVTTASAIVRTGASPVFVDIEPEYLGLSVDNVETAIGKKTKAIFPVHYAGVACDIEEISNLAKRHRLRVVEDAAQALGSSLNGHALGSIGDLGTVSFHETKNCISGEGGALWINDELLIERAETLLNKGTNRKAFLRGEADKYTWVDLGSSFVPSEIVAAFLWAQLENIEQISNVRRQQHRRYRTALLDLEERGYIRLPRERANAHSNGHIFYLLVESSDIQQRLIAHLRSRSILAVFHYVPLHSSPYAVKAGLQPRRPLPVTDSIAERLVRLPLFFELTANEQDLIIAAVREFFVG